MNLFKQLDINQMFDKNPNDPDNENKHFTE